MKMAGYNFKQAYCNNICQKDMKNKIFYDFYKIQMEKNPRFLHLLAMIYVRIYAKNVFKIFYHC